MKRNTGAVVGVIFIAALTYLIVSRFILVPELAQPGTVATTTPQATTTPVIKPISSEIRLRAYTTAYTYWDNTPPGSSVIAFAKNYGYPTFHNVAGGTGTYSDPITIAVGHVIKDGKDTPDYKPGTIFYIPNFRLYFVVEDTCGDGDTPQNIPCHTNLDQPGVVQIDLWIGGASGSKEQTDSCASALTETHLIIQKPEKNYAVVPGELFNDGSCTAQYGDAVVTQ